jgi:hypothetical protein
LDPPKSSHDRLYEQGVQSMKTKKESEIAQRLKTEAAEL